MPRLTYGMLRNQAGEPGPHPFLYCGECGARYSANAGDYWNVPKDRPVECECGEPMILALEKTRIVSVRP